MKKLLLPLVVAALPFLCLAGKVAVYDDLMRPNRIMVDDHRIFIVEVPHILIYSLEDHTLIKKFGGRGEGPMEFMGNNLNLLPYPDHIIVNSQGKITYWSKSGDFIKEVKCPFAAGVEPCGDVFVSLGFRARTDQDPFNYQTIDVYDRNFNKIREIDRRKSPFQGQRGIRVYAQAYYFYIMNNMYIIVTGHEGYELNVFDKEGELLYTIRRDHDPIPVTEADRREVHQYFKTHPRFKAVYEARKHLIKIADHFPAIQGFQPIGNKLYVFTYKKKEGKTQFFIYDDNGNLMREVYLPLVKKDIRSTYPFTIDRDKFYRLVENDETEEWELFIDEII